MRDEMAQDPFYKVCVFKQFKFIGMGPFESCDGRIEWHHNLIYGGRQVNEIFCILPVCHAHHMVADRRDVKAFLNRVMATRATEEDKAKFPRISIDSFLKYPLPADMSAIGIKYPAEMPL